MAMANMIPQVGILSLALITPAKPRSILSSCFGEQGGRDMHFGVKEDTVFEAAPEVFSGQNLPPHYWTRI